MAVNLSPIGNAFQFLTTGGQVLNSGLIYTYAAGGTTPTATYTTSAGSVANANPIVLGVDGRCATEIWLTQGTAYRFDLKDSLGNLIQTYDNLYGVNDLTAVTTSFGFAIANDANATAGRATLGLADATAKGSILVSTGAGAFVEKTAGTDGSALIVDSTQTNGFLWVPQYPETLLSNPLFMIDQRHIGLSTAILSDTYAQDRWYILTQTASVNVSTQADQENGQNFNCLITQNQASAQRFGIAQIIEGLNCKWLRGQQVTFRPRVNISNSQAIRIAVLEWTGTEDIVTSNVVNTWTSSTYTPGNFFLASNLTVSGVGAKTPSAATWTDMDPLTVTLGSSFNNLIVFAWTEGTAAQNVTLGIGKMRLTRGNYAGEIHIPTFQEMWSDCRRYYWKSFDDGIAPAQNVGTSSGEIIGIAGKAGVSASGGTMSVRFPMEMRTTPAMTYYNPSVANAQMRDWTASVDMGSTATLDVTSASFAVTATGNASTAVGNIIRVHATADGEL